MPTSLFLQGWLRGWISAFNTPPRLETLAEEFSRELRSTGVDAGCFLALLTPKARLGQAGLEHTVSYEAISFGLPPPLLVTGSSALSFRTPQSAELGPPLPIEHHSVRTVRIDRLAAPWRLLVATDGLLRRLGHGSEQRGLRFIREWQTGPARDELPSRHLETGAPVIDDELFVIVQWGKWDEELEFSILEDGSRHNAIGIIGQEVAQVLGPKRSIEFQFALVEALENARQHGYGDAGTVLVRFREEEQHFRVEVEDAGTGGVTERMVLEGSGFAVMRRWVTEVDVRTGTERGTIVSLMIEKRGQSEEPEK